MQKCALPLLLKRGPVICSDNRSSLFFRLCHYLNDIAAEVGVSPDVRVSPHTCRHTFAHLQLRNGLDLYSLSRLMGHENIAITQRYLDGIRDDEVLEKARATGVLAHL